MEKRKLSDEFGSEDRPRRRPQGRGERTYRGRSNDDDRLHRNGPGMERNVRVEKFVRPPRTKKDEDRQYRHTPRNECKRITKMFISKEEMVKYVNKTGEEGHQIDIYKIEDDLYKVVVLELPKRRPRIENLEVEL